MIRPAIIPQSIAHLRDTLAQLATCTRAVQVDIVDGAFAPFRSWPFAEPHGDIADLATLASAHDIELDLMVSAPEKELDAWLQTGVTAVVLHVGSTDVLSECIARVREAGARVGIAAASTMPAASFVAYVPEVDFVQYMGIAAIGQQGAPFDESVLEHIADVRRAYPELEIAVDGAVNADTLPRLRDSGADRFAVGSAVLSASDPCTAYHELCELAGDNGDNQSAETI